MRLKLKKVNNGIKDYWEWFLIGDRGENHLRSHRMYFTPDKAEEDFRTVMRRMEGKVEDLEVEIV